ncbi:minor capsid protein [Pseudonocardia sp. McavD-2-B]|uniref:minor capsid protein n=1 Tax=Pseudonocardia sp. McavD-2-B TaxID=2954499 RepID=UPI00209815C5|nr:minor capsid protein [Pseudonocardia sp. McavD-2-B]MCO7196897.1 minor capsid protein [Pseudonocardia sp. McavD-2-B]
MAELRMTWNGGQVKDATGDAVLRGLATAGEHLLSVSRMEVPIEEGTLERSGRATVDQASYTAAVSYDTPYAVRQHEELGYRHDSGRKAKYLEDPLNREGQVMLALVAAECRRSLR